MSLPVSDSVHTKHTGNMTYKIVQLTVFVTKVQSAGMTCYKYQHLRFRKLLLTFDSLHADVVGRFPFVAVRLPHTWSPELRTLHVYQPLGTVRPVY